MKNSHPLVKNILDDLSSFAPLELAEKWDHAGLQVGRSNCKVTGVLVALDATGWTLHEAVQKKLNLIITHHPLLPSKLTQSLKTLARKHQINILSFHTNLDSTSGGLNDLLAKKLHLKNTRPLLPNPQHPKVGLGRVGRLSKPIGFDQLCQNLMRAFGLAHLRYVGNKKARLKTIAVMSGSGGGFYREAKQAGADALVTGDVKYHHALEAMAEGICLVDIGHYHSEIEMTALITKLLKRKFLTLTIQISQTSQDPFQIKTPPISFLKKSPMAGILFPLSFETLDPG
ncbi:MAG: Nif3-like dinuclear metal center hexameric protein [Deltaproteobacteria bacterium]|nr:Nif3-like dinuclear metal center hexameric protein [Deltaproteobacteria bacterium]